MSQLVYKAIFKNDSLLNYSHW